MELRKVEQDLEKLSSEWKSLRRKRPYFNDEANNDATPTTVSVAHGVSSEDQALSNWMPSWKELNSKVKDEEIFPPEEENGHDNIDTEDSSANANNNGSSADATNHEASISDADAAGYSEFGMCLAPSGNTEIGTENAKVKMRATSAKNGESIWERYAAKETNGLKSKIAESVKVETETSEPAVDDEGEEETKVEDASAKDLLAALESLHKRFIALGTKIDKFLMKLNDRDPVTKKARYGERTMLRVKNAVRIYKALEQGVTVVFHDLDNDPCLVSILRSKIQHRFEQLNAQNQAHQSQQQLAAERLAKEQLLLEERANQQRLLVEQKKRDEERQLARRAEEARLHRVEEEQLALEAERQVDRELLALVPTLGVEGVREQIGRMREGLKDDKTALDVALGSLYTLFEQIVRKPEEINFRRIRRDHPKFMEDIGRYVGGQEVLIAAGFKLEKLDGVPCFSSKEPHIESDMDGWSDWFDTLKKTLEVVEEEMLK